MLVTRKRAYLGGFVSILALGMTMVAVLAGRPRQPTGAGETSESPAFQTTSDDESSAIPVKTIRPKNSPSFVISIQEPAYVEAYFQVDLFARVAGPVKYVAKDKGDRVRRGEVLVEIDVPDLVQDVAQKEAVVEQKLADVRLAEAQIKIAEDAVEVAGLAIPLKETEVRQAEATMKFRKSEVERFRVMVDRQSVVGELFDERLSQLEAAEALRDSAQIAVKKASADFREMQAKLEAARADLRLKQSIVEVARKDRDRAQALADFATIYAPFSGVIIDRKVDPGSFVHNATTGHVQPAITVARTDLVTVYMRLPESYVDFVTTDTEAIIQLNGRPGELIHGKVTRFTPALQGQDRIMKVEVDLYNRPEQDYRRFTARGLAWHLAPLASSRSVGTAASWAAVQTVWSQNRKGAADPFPLFPKLEVQNASAPHRPLLPGMYGYMRLLLQRFDKSYLLPSHAVISRGGKRYIVQVKDGKVHLVPVRMEVDDGNLAKVAVIIREARPRIGEQEVFQELRGDEEIVVGGQGELSEGQVVHPTHVDW